MNISGFQKLSLLDYPGKLSCIIFTQGCNFKCSFCHNSDLINQTQGLISLSEIFDYLNKRQKLLDGVVISGGEPTIQKDLKHFCKQIKSLGLLVKLDTNGSNPKLLQELIDEQLVDYVAMDIKNDFSDYHLIIGKQTNQDKIKKSIELLQTSHIDYEFRTTIMKNYHNFNQIKKICQYLDKKSKYYLQNFKNTESVVDQKLISFKEEELKTIETKLKKEFPNVKVRGI